MCSGVIEGYHAETVRNLCRVTDIIFSKCSNIGVLKLTQPFDRQNLPLAAFAGRIGAFAIHGSGLALGNVLLPSCWEMYRTLRKSNILHKAQILDCLSVVSCFRFWAHFIHKYVTSNGYVNSHTMLNVWTFWDILCCLSPKNMKKWTFIY